MGASRTAIETPSRLFNDSPQGPGLEGHPVVPMHSSLTTTRPKSGDWSASGLDLYKPPRVRVGSLTVFYPISRLPFLMCANMMRLIFTHQ